MDKTKFLEGRVQSKHPRPLVMIKLIDSLICYKYKMKLTMQLWRGTSLGKYWGGIGTHNGFTNSTEK